MKPTITLLLEDRQIFVEHSDLKLQKVGESEYVGRKTGKGKCACTRKNRFVVKEENQ